MVNQKGADTAQSKDDLLEQVEKLQKELKYLRAKERIASRATTAVGRIFARVFAGRYLYHDSKIMFDDLNDWSQSGVERPFPGESIRTWMAAVVNRFFWIGSISTMIALFVPAILILQTIIFHKQTEAMNLQKSVLDSQLEQQKVSLAHAAASLSMELRALSPNSGTVRSGDFVYKPNEAVVAQLITFGKIEGAPYIRDLLEPLIEDADPYLAASAFIAWARVGIRNRELSPNLRYADLSFSNLNYAGWDSLTANNVMLTGIHAYESNFPGMDLYQGIAIGSDWTGANLVESVIKRSDFRHAVFADADIDRIEFDRSCLVNADFNAARIDKGAFRDSNLTCSDLRFSNVKKGGKGVNYESIDFAGSNIYLAKGPPAFLEAAFADGAFCALSDGSRLSLEECSLALREDRAMQCGSIERSVSDYAISDIDREVEKCIDFGKPQ